MVVGSYLTTDLGRKKGTNKGLFCISSEVKVYLTCATKMSEIAESAAILIFNFVRKAAQSNGTGHLSSSQ